MAQPQACPGEGTPSVRRAVLFRHEGRSAHDRGFDPARSKVRLDARMEAPHDRRGKARLAVAEDSASDLANAQESEETDVTGPSYLRSIYP